MSILKAKMKYRKLSRAEVRKMHTYGERYVKDRLRDLQRTQGTKFKMRGW